jgi:hypothetical protein
MFSECYWQRLDSRTRPIGLSDDGNRNRDRRKQAQQPGRTGKLGQKKKKTKAGSNKVMNDERTEDWVRFMLLTCQIKHFMEG